MDRQTDRQIFYTSVCFFIQLNLLPPYSLGWQGDKISLVYFNVVQLQRLCLLLFIQADTIADMHKKSQFAFSAKQNFASFANLNISKKLSLQSKTFLYSKYNFFFLTNHICQVT